MTGIPPVDVSLFPYDGHNNDALTEWLGDTPHRWEDGRLVIMTGEHDARPEPGWALVRWTGHEVTIASRKPTRLLAALLEENRRLTREIGVLQESTDKLNALEAWGVDNWDGYDDAMQSLDTGKEPW